MPDAAPAAASRMAPEEMSLAQLRKLAGHGDADAQFALGQRYEQGKNVAQDYRKAAVWYRQAAKQGNGQAYYNLGRMNELALGVTRDMPKAVQRYTDAAKLGNADAQHRLGLMFEAGESIALDNQDAAEWYRQVTAAREQEAARLEAEARAKEEADKAEAEARARTDPATGMPLFSIYEYTVDGNSLLSNLAIENAISGFMGDRKTLRDVEAARAALERAYHDAGYMTVVVTIPEQDVNAGAVALHVVEADIERLKVKGTEYALPSAIKSRVPELAEGKVPNFNKLQAELTALNRTADVRITPILRAGKAPGTVEVQLDVEDQLALHGSVEFSNRQTPNTTPQRLSASLRYDNLWQRGHSFALTMQVAPQRVSDARVLAGTYVLPIDSSGDSLTLYGVHSRSQFASLSGAPGLGLLGNTDTLGTRFSLPLGSGKDYSQTFAVGVDYKNVKQTLLLQGGIGSDSPISYAPLVATYSGNLFGQNRSTMLSLTATSGLRGFFGNSDEEFNAKRSGASASFLALRTTLQHTESFSRWSVYGKLDMQASSGPLVPTEQFLAGGAESVRGYLEGEQAGDAGMLATLELRTPQFSLGGGSAWRLSGLAFIDASRLSIRQPVAPQPEVQRLSGTGFGLRFSAPHGLTIEVDAARALRDGDITHSGDRRAHARALWAF